MWPTPGSKPGEVNKDIRDVVQIVDHAGNLEQNSTWLVFNSGEFGFQKPICHYQLTADLLGRIYHRLFNFLNNFLKRDLGGRGKKFLNFHLDRKIIARWC